jgi:hypothetical protein
MIISEEAKDYKVFSRYCTISIYNFQLRKKTAYHGSNFAAQLEDSDKNSLLY